MKPEPITVTYLNEYIKLKVAGDEFLNNVFVKGEISNFKHHYTGHMYFTLKDEKSLIKCVMFKTSTTTLNFMPKDGMKVLILGTVGVYERDGVYQIYCKAMQEDGLGTLHERFEKLKSDLEKEGFFDNNNKKKIPFMPNVIGVLTSTTGSVIRDIINVSTRRNPNVYIKVVPIPVQGQGAEVKISEAIKLANENKIADVLILARGGGSLEDLWPFNEKIVAEAIYDSEIPIISAVGHETDFTISDFTADLRAPTPSAAAELAVPNIVDIKNNINIYEVRYRTALLKKIDYVKLKYEKCINSTVFRNPLQQINEKYICIDSQVKALENEIMNKLKDSKTLAMEKITKLDTLSPLKTLTRGYSITQKNGKIIKSKNELKNNDLIEIKFTDGTTEAKVINI